MPCTRKSRLSLSTNFLWGSFESNRTTSGWVRTNLPLNSAWSSWAISGILVGSSSILALLDANWVCSAWQACHTAASCISDSSLLASSVPNWSGGTKVMRDFLTAVALSPSIATTSTDKSPESAASLHRSCFRLSLPKICLRAIFGVWASSL